MRMRQSKKLYIFVPNLEENFAFFKKIGFFLAHLGQIWLHGGPKTGKTVFFAVISGVKGLTTVYNKRFIHAASQITQRTTEL